MPDDEQRGDIYDVCNDPACEPCSEPDAGAAMREALTHENAVDCDEQRGEQWREAAEKYVREIFDASDREMERGAFQLEIDQLVGLQHAATEASREEIERLKGELGDMGTRRNYWKDRAERAEAERDELREFRATWVKNKVESATADLRERLERQNDAIDETRQWAKAYPVEIFHEPTKDELKRAHEVLKANGMGLDAISASNMRHVITQVVKILDAALAPQEKSFAAALEEHYGAPPSMGAAAAAGSESTDCLISKLIVRAKAPGLLLKKAEQRRLAAALEVADGVVGALQGMVENFDPESTLHDQECFNASDGCAYHAQDGALVNAKSALYRARSHGLGETEGGGGE